MESKASRRQVEIQKAGRAVLGIALLVLVSVGCVSIRKPFALREVSPGIYEGYKPQTQAHFNELRLHGVRTILSLEQLPWHISPERKMVRESGMEYRDIPIMASPLAPKESRVKDALLVIHDYSLRPIFVHCFLGEDRTTFIVGLYRIYFEDWTPEAAWEEMLRSGFHVRWSLRGFSNYFWSHTEKPDWVLALRQASPEATPITHADGLLFHPSGTSVRSPRPVSRCVRVRQGRLP